MSTIVIVLVAAAVAVGIAAVIGAGPLVLVIVPIVVAVAAWLAVLAASRRTVGGVTHEASSQHELLGPGGPDDPER